MKGVIDRVIDVLDDRVNTQGDNKAPSWELHLLETGKETAGWQQRSSVIVFQRHSQDPCPSSRLRPVSSGNQIETTVPVFSMRK